MMDANKVAAFIGKLKEAEGLIVTLHKENAELREALWDIRKICNKLWKEDKYQYNAMRIARIWQRIDKTSLKNEPAPS
jgi:hypothetical protein